MLFGNYYEVESKIYIPKNILKVLQYLHCPVQFQTLVLNVYHNKNHI